MGERGTALSKHAETDVTLLRHLARRFGTIYTTEPAVHARSGVPYLEAPSGAAREHGMAPRAVGAG